LKAGRLDELALHPTVKPVAMIAEAIKDVSHRNGIVLDLFGGSGSTLIAAHKTGRRARLCELDPVYCDRILQRWELFAKDDAELIACGRFGGPANDVNDEQAVEKQIFQEKNEEIPTARKRKLRAEAGTGDLETRARPTSGGSSFGSRRPRRASC
jgi:DNA methylase